MNSLARVLLASVTLPVLGCGARAVSPDEPTITTAFVASVEARVESPGGEFPQSVPAVRFAQYAAPVSEEHTGACTVRTFPIASTSGGSAGEPTTQTAGPVTIYGGLQPVVVNDDGHRYASIAEPGANWTEGNVVEFRAPGASVPSFHVDVTFPSTPSITSPTNGATVPLDRARDFTVSWVPFSVGFLDVTITQATAQGSVAIDCAFDGVRGNGAVPASVLARLAADPQATTTGEIGGASTIRTMVGPYRVQFRGFTFVTGVRFDVR